MPNIIKPTVIFYSVKMPILYVTDVQGLPMDLIIFAYHRKIETEHPQCHFCDQNFEQTVFEHKNSWPFHFIIATINGKKEKNKSEH